MKDTKTRNILNKLGTVKQQKAGELYPQDQCIVLDPQAPKPLTPHDFTTYKIMIVGGLLGYEKPQGRTKALTTDKASFATRHLGNLQLSIDGAVFVIKAISLGLKLEDIEIAKEIEIIHDKTHSTILPFGYPVIDNTPIITPGLVEYLARL